MTEQATFDIKEGDTRPTFEYQLQRDGNPIDLRAAEAVHFRVEQASNQALVIDSEATIKDAANGVVSYTLSPDDTLPVNEYHAEFEIQWDTEGNQIQHVPKKGYIKIDVNRPIGGELDPTDVIDPNITVTTINVDNIAANTGTSISLQNDIDAGGNDITGLGSLEVDEVNNTVFVPEGESVVDAIDTVDTTFGTGTVHLQPGEHVTPHIEIPSGITLAGTNANDQSGKTTTIVPDGDHHGVSLLGSSNGMARLENLHIDCSGIAGYSSDAVRILSGTGTGGTRQLPWVENVSVEGTPGQGNGIHFNDVNNVGISWVTVRGCRVLGFNNCIRKTATGTDGFVNGTVLDDVWLRNGTVLINEQGTVNNNLYSVKVQISSNTEDIISSTGQYTLDIHSFDSHNSPSDRLIEVRDVGAVTKNEITSHGGQRMIREGIYGGGVRRTVMNPETELSWVTATPSPNWLVESGTGSVTNDNFIARLETGATTGDTFRLADGGNRSFFINQHADPWLHLHPEAVDTTNVIARIGWSHTGASPFEALFYADPTDSLGTGITGNWIWRVVDDDGSVLTEADSGVALGTQPRMDICMSNDGNHVFGCVSGSMIEDVALNTRQQFISPLFEVETTADATKRLELHRTVRLRYLDGE